MIAKPLRFLEACFKSGSRRRKEAENRYPRASNPPPYVGGYKGEAIPKYVLTLFAVLAIFNLPLIAAVPAQPNIILVMTDDQGYGDLGWTGNPIIRTPHIDAFAKESVRFTDFHVSPTCAIAGCRAMQVC